MGKYSIGIDFGTLSARAVLVELSTGKTVAESEFVYPNAIMDGGNFGLSSGTDVAYQHPKDYLDALKFSVEEVVRCAGIDASEIKGVGIDFTSCTCLPTLADGTPLCFLDEFKNDPEAYVKLWKHHGAAAEADRFTEVAKERGESFLSVYGGRVSSEWLFPKLYEIKNNSPKAFAATEKYLEAADWLTGVLTGKCVVSACTAGYKAFWEKENGYPSDEFFSAVDSSFCGVVGTKICTDVRPTGTYVGDVTENGAWISSLPFGCAVSTPIIDAHSAMLSSGAIKDGTLLLVLGTSACHILISKEDKAVEGICGKVADGVVEGFVAYEAGQSSFGDTFDWFVNSCVPERLFAEARERGVDIYSILNERAAMRGVCKNPLLVLDFWNGNRTPYDDANLSGSIIGLTAKTRPEDIYRAIIEACAFGTRRIVEIYERAGVAVRAVVSAGGISNKNPYLMQTLSNVLDREIRVLAGTQTAAKGAAVLGAYVSGEFDSITCAADALFDGYSAHYVPDMSKKEYYDNLYALYLEASEYYAKQSDLMHKLRRMQER